MSGHTPAPWHVDGVEVFGADGKHVVWELGNSNDADHALIAAAPELLACLRRMCGMYGAYSRRLAPLLAEDDGTIWTFERANSLACVAIAKAEGTK